MVDCSGQLSGFAAQLSVYPKVSVVFEFIVGWGNYICSPLSIKQLHWLTEVIDGVLGWENEVG
jgi:hypothetical protein